MKHLLLLTAGLALLIAACGGGRFSSSATPAPARSAPISPASTPQAAQVLKSDERTAPTVPPAARSDPAATSVPPAATRQMTATTEASRTPRPTATATRAPTATAPPTPRPLIARYADTPTYGGVNLRRGTATTTAVILTVPYGASVASSSDPVTGADGAAWYEAMYRDERGFVLAALLSTRKPDPIPTATPTPRPTITPSPAATPTQRPTVTPAPQSTSPGGEEEWTLTAVGDIMLSRSVLRRMEAYGSYRHPYTGTADILRAADFTVANLEGQISDNVAPSGNPNTMSFMSPAAVLDGVRWSGIDAVSLANNHALDFGTNALVDSMAALDEAGIGYFGAGSNRQSSLRASVYTIGGHRVAFLGFTDLSNAGFPHASLPTTTPAYSPAQVAATVRAADEIADVVIPYFHWGVEYVSVPNGRQQSLAYAAIDAGADLVLGAHPHWVQSTERYRDTLIVYSLGNFVFDQMWSAETRQGVIATFTFDGSRIAGVRYTPVLIEDYNRPRIATGTDRDAVLQRMGVSNSGE